MHLAVKDLYAIIFCGSTQIKLLYNRISNFLSLIMGQVTISLLLFVAPSPPLSEISNIEPQPDASATSPVDASLISSDWEPLS